MRAGELHRSWPGMPVRRTCLFIGSLSVLLQDSLGWWLWESAPVPEEPIPLNLTIHAGEEVGWEWLDGGIRVAQVAANAANIDTHGAARRSSSACPEQWDSSSCMESWGVPELQREVDPRGYIVFSEGREQLGNNRFLLSDGIAIAKALNRTLVEFPMKDSRIAKADADLGFCAYWDCARLCSYHRILDILSFRSMLQEGLIQLNDFVEVVSADREQTLMPSLVSAENITNFFYEYDTWQGWGGGQHLAVQWRTETSTGNLSRCYERYVVPAIEEQRYWLGFERSQVYFNTDLVSQASTTYNTSVVLANQGVVDRIREDYPAAMENAVYNCLDNIQDAGVKAMISGIASASSSFLLSSSFNTSGCNECQKPHSKYIDLIAEWRFGVFDKDFDPVGQMFPSCEEGELGSGAHWPMHIAGLMGVLVVAGVLVAKIDLLGRVKMVKLS